MVISSLTGLTIGAVVSLVANVFVNGIRYFEALRLDLILKFSSFQSSEFIIPFAWLAIGFTLVFVIKKVLGCTSWQGPADAIYCAHRPDRNMDIRQGFGTVMAAFTSLSAGASLGQYGPIVHMGALIGGLFRKYNLPISYTYDKETLFNYIKTDKKIKGDTLNIILLKEEGNAYIKTISLNKIKEYM